MDNFNVCLSAVSICPACYEKVNFFSIFSFLGNLPLLFVRTRNMASPNMLWITSFSPQRWLGLPIMQWAMQCVWKGMWIDVVCYGWKGMWISLCIHVVCYGWTDRHTSQVLGIDRKSTPAKFWSSENWENLVWKIMICWIRRNSKQLFVAHCWNFLCMHSNTLHWLL